VQKNKNKNKNLNTIDQSLNDQSASRKNQSTPHPQDFLFSI